MLLKTLIIDSENRLTLDTVNAFVFNKSRRISMSGDENFCNIINANRLYLEDLLNSNEDIYGVTTGYGNSSSNRFDASKAQQLQHNLIQYHNCGVGPYLTEEQCTASLIIRLNCLSKGRSGVSLELLKKLADLADSRIIPAIPSMGSVGASGDLTPLSYIAAALEGSGNCYFNGKICTTSDLFKSRNIAPYRFLAKEALAIMNGTSVMTAISAIAWQEAKRVADLACCATALMVEILEGRTSPFESSLHDLKPYPGQKMAAQKIFDLINNAGARHTRKNETLKNNESIGSIQRLQDSYSVRCAPQVIGVLYDTLDWTQSWLEIEMNSVNDNPVFFHENRNILNGGHFYGGHVAAACDALKTATANVLNLIDKQLAILVDSRFSGILPDNLVAKQHLGADSHLNHGYKAMQITCSALTAEALKNSIPMSIFSRSTECLNQDVVSMGTIAARDLANITTISKSVVAIHLMALRQAVFVSPELQLRDRLNEKCLGVIDSLAELSPVVIEDRPLDLQLANVAMSLFSTCSGVFANT